MIAFQNLLYPMLIMVPKPIYFLVLVSISKIVEIQIFIKHSDLKKRDKILQMLVFGCQIIYHATFFIFYYVTQEQVIIYNSILCLGIYLLGIVFNFLLVFSSLIPLGFKVWQLLKDSKLMKSFMDYIQRKSRVQPLK